MSLAGIPLPLLPLAPLVALLALLLRAELRAPRAVAQVRVLKPLCTAAVIAICALAFTRAPERQRAAYTALLLAGLLFSLAGDWLLIDRDNPRAFKLGLRAFLLAHLAYTGAFFAAQVDRGLPLSPFRELGVAAALTVALFLVFLYLRPHLGELGRPVLLYMVVISLMLHRALCGVLVGASVLSQPALAAGGAALFYVADLMLGVERFALGGDDPSSQLWILGGYYAAQTMIALSASFFV